MTVFIIMFSLFTAALTQALPIPANPFNHDLGIKVLGYKDAAQEITICCHGYGHSNQIVDVMHAYRVFDHPLVGFNFPDHSITLHDDHSNLKYGSIDELLPLLHIIKFYTCDHDISTINLYGFSAGGGAVVNALAILNNYSYQEELQKIGITPDNAKKIITVLQKGTVILECPLKSMQEIIDLRGAHKDLVSIARVYEKNNLNPIDNIARLSGLDLTIIVHFENPDHIISNRDDELFIERLKKANSGTTHVSIGTQGGHVGYHKSLWECYKRVQK